MKKCVNCKIEKDLSCFKISHCSKDGYNYACNLCHGYKRKTIKQPKEIRKLVKTLRSRISHFLNGRTRKCRTSDILGCSYEEFKIYIESQFEPWMTWENRGLYNGEFNHGWDIDHIIPLSSAKTEEEAYKLNHYTNLQPLCSKTNRHIKINRT